MGNRLAGKDDRDSLLTGALLLMGLERDERMLELLQRIDQAYPDDGLGVFIMGLVCEHHGLDCDRFGLRARLRALAPDTGLAWMYGFRPERVMDAAALAGLASLDRIDDRLSEITSLVRSAVLAHSPPPEVTVPLEAMLSPDEAVAYASWSGAFALPILPFNVLVWPCHPKRDEFLPESRDDCLEIGRTLFMDDRNSILSRMIGSVILRRLTPDSPEGKAAFEYRKQYVWLVEQTRKLGKNEVVSESFLRDMENIGEWPAFVAWAEGLGIAPHPPEDWIPDDSEALLLADDRPSRQ